MGGHIVDTGFNKRGPHRVVQNLEVGILGQKWNHDILSLLQFLVPRGIQLWFCQ